MTQRRVSSNFMQNREGREALTTILKYRDNIKTNLCAVWRFGLNLCDAVHEPVPLS
jgi:hypothetical protein